MNRQEMTDALVEWDIKRILRAYEHYCSIEFLDAVLRGDGFTPYNQLTDEQLKEEWEAMK